MKKVELKLISELMKNSRRSDRELARAIGASQPTVTRMIKKFEKEGIIREYTMIPDFSKVGYHLVAFNLTRLKPSLSPDDIERAKNRGLKDMEKGLSEVVLFERGLGELHNGLTISFHKTYSGYVKLKEHLRSVPYMDPSVMQSFVIDLKDKLHFRYLTFSALANDLLIPPEREEETFGEHKARNTSSKGKTAFRSKKKNML